MSSIQLSWTQTLQDGALLMSVNLDLYSLEALFRVCYSFTDRCYIFLDHNGDTSIVNIHLAKKSSNCDLTALAGEFSNELIDQKVRLDIAAETRTIRELIVAQAFTEADLLDRCASEADYNQDPRDISK
jgi:His-Xaa-Ser system protein HxsD